MNISQAIAYSCDVFFYTVGLEVGIKRLSRYAELFGLGQPSGIELSGETRGLVPSPEWKARTFKRPSDKKWYEGETVNAAIGQGYTLVTPLQMGRVVSAIVNGGYLVTPHLIESIRNSKGEEEFQGRMSERKQVLQNTQALEIIREGLKQVVESRSPFFGTAWRAKNDKVAIMGKTGTAQVAYFKERAETAEELERIPYELRDHAWFVGAMEAKEEPLTIVVFCEHSGHGSESAVPIARDLAIKIAEMESNAVYAVQSGEENRT
jgi:penicillin-binding protein 2